MPSAQSLLAVIVSPREGSALPNALRTRREKEKADSSSHAPQNDMNPSELS
jgi:hypothetical protein